MMRKKGFHTGGCYCTEMRIQAALYVCSSSAAYCTRNGAVDNLLMDADGNHADIFGKQQITQTRLS
jgi:hypothetical protein